MFIISSQVVFLFTQYNQVETVEEDPPKDESADSLHDLVVKSKFVGENEADVSEIHTRAINGKICGWDVIRYWDVLAELILKIHLEFRCKGQTEECVGHIFTMGNAFELILM